MAITATFYTFSKKKNSTAVPSGGSSYNILIKDPSSILNPRIDLDASNPVSYNYCYIPAFNRYYFINDWTSDHGHWIADCSVDVLASWKASITASYQYVLRCSTQNDSNIVDRMYPMTDEVSFGKYDFPTRPFLNSSNDLRYIIGISNANSSNTVGGLSYYNMPFGEFVTLMHKLLGSSSYLGDFSLDGLSDALVKALVNPLSYIGESYILPYNLASGYSQASLLDCGWWPVDVSNSYTVFKNSAMLNRHEIWRTNNVAIPVHPQTLSEGAYINCAPYTKLTLYAGPFGNISLDPTLLHNCQRVDFIIFGDFKGNIELEIHGWQSVSNTLTEFIIDKRSASCAIPLSLTQINSKPESAVSIGTSAASAAANAAMANPAGLCANLATGLDSAQSYFIPKIDGNASVGSFDEALKPWSILAEFSHITDSEVGIFGKPLCTDIQLSQLPGTPYVLCSNSHLDIPCYSSEHDAIINYMNTGFYIE